MRKGDSAVGMVHGARSGLSSIRPDTVIEDPDSADPDHGTIRGVLNDQPVLVQTAADLEGTESSRAQNRQRIAQWADAAARQRPTSPFSVSGGYRSSGRWEDNH